MPTGGERVATSEHQTWAYRVAAAKLRAAHPQPCTLCHQWIDYSLSYPHRRSFSAEHVVPVRDGGTWRQGLLPAHLGCQWTQGARATNAITSARPAISGVW